MFVQKQFFYILSLEKFGPPPGNSLRTPMSMAYFRTTAADVLSVEQNQSCIHTDVCSGFLQLMSNLRGRPWQVLPR